MTHFAPQYACTQLRWGNNILEPNQPFREEWLIFVTFLSFTWGPQEHTLAPHLLTLLVWPTLPFSFPLTPDHAQHSLQICVFALLPPAFQVPTSSSHVFPSIFLPFHCQHLILRSSAYKVFEESSAMCIMSHAHRKLVWLINWSLVQSLADGELERRKKRVYFSSPWNRGHKISDISEINSEG